MRRRTLVPIACLLLSACAVDDAPGAVRAAIIDGALAPDDDAVVVVQDVARGQLCSGTLVSRRVVVTAKHCTFGAEPTGIAVGFGDSVAEARDATIFSREHRETTGMVIDGQDVAVVILLEDAPVAPVAFARVDDGRALLGTTVRVVGFGLDESGGVGVRRAVDDRVIETGGAEFATQGPSACQGDSGGPAFDASGLLVGVTARGREGCLDRAIFGRVAYWRALVDAAIAESGECVPTDELCNGRDDDCDGETDEGCSAPGEPCADDSRCTEGTCMDTGAGPRCTVACDASLPLGQCPPGSYCDGDGCDGLCVQGEPGAGLLGSRCATDLDCASLRCRRPDAGGDSRCAEPCTQGAGRCVAGTVCVADEAGCGACDAPPRVWSPRQLGEPCASDRDCASRHCVEDACATTCATGTACPGGFDCRDVEGVGLCVRRVREPIGLPCLDDLDCESGFCGELAGVKFCTAPCGRDAPCPEGASCAPATGGAMACVPASATLGQACTDASDCLSAACARTGGHGTCTRTCTASAPCPAGFSCVPAADGVPICLARDGSTGPTCACGLVSGGRPEAGVIAALALLASALLGRAARRRRR